MTKRGGKVRGGAEEEKTREDDEEKGGDQERAGIEVRLWTCIRNVPGSSPGRTARFSCSSFSFLSLGECRGSTVNCYTLHKL